MAHLPTPVAPPWILCRKMKCAVHERPEDKSRSAAVLAARLSSPPSLAGLRQGVDGIVVLVFARQRARLTGVERSAIVLGPVGNTLLAIVLIPLMDPALSNVGNVADDPRGREARQVAHDLVLKRLRLVNREAPMLRVGD